VLGFSLGVEPAWDSFSLCSSLIPSPAPACSQKKERKKKEKEKKKKKKRKERKEFLPWYCFS